MIILSCGQYTNVGIITVALCPLLSCTEYCIVSHPRLKTGFTLYISRYAAVLMTAISCGSTLPFSAFHSILGISLVMENIYKMMMHQSEHLCNMQVTRHHQSCVRRESATHCHTQTHRLIKDSTKYSICWRLASLD